MLTLVYNRLGRILKVSKILKRTLETSGGCFALSALFSRSFSNLPFDFATGYKVSFVRESDERALVRMRTLCICVHQELMNLTGLRFWPINETNGLTDWRRKENEASSRKEISQFAGQNK